MAIWSEGITDKRYTEIRSHIYSHLSPVYPKDSKTIFGAMMSGIAWATHLIRLTVDSIRGNIFYKQAKGEVKIGIRASVNMPGVSVRIVDDNWRSNDPLNLVYDSDKSTLRLGDNAAVRLDRIANEYNLNDEADIGFIVFVNPNNLPTSRTVKEVVFTDKKTPDYLGELAKNRGVIRRDSEGDALLQERCITIGMQATINRIKKQLEWLLGTDNFYIKEFIEYWESPAIPGCSFVGYSPVRRLRPIKQMREYYFGSHFFEISMNTFRFEVLLPAGVGHGITDQEILNLCNEIKVSGVLVEINRELS